MKTYKQIHFTKITEILMQAAMGVSAVCDSAFITSDMVHSLSDLHDKIYSSKMDEPYYIAIREQGTENGFKERCIDRCKGLGYPIVIAKIFKDKTWDYNMTIMFTHGWIDEDNNYMEQEFDSL